MKPRQPHKPLARHSTFSASTPRLIKITEDDVKALVPPFVVDTQLTDDIYKKEMDTPHNSPRIKK